MIVREAYRDSTVSICHDHYHERKPRGFEWPREKTP